MVFDVRHLWLVPLQNHARCDRLRPGHRTRDLLNDTAQIEVAPVRIDYVVVDEMTDRDRDALSDEIGHCGLYPVSARRSIQIYPLDASLILDQVNHALLFSRIFLSRYLLGVPYIPGVPAGDCVTAESATSYDDDHWDACASAALILRGPSGEVRFEQCQLASQ